MRVINFKGDIRFLFNIFITDFIYDLKRLSLLVSVLSLNFVVKRDVYFYFIYLVFRFII